jgi:hypothetical protein
MTEGCKKTYGELYAQNWQEDLDDLTSLSRGIFDKISFGIQVALAASETAFAPEVIAGFLPSLSAEIGASTGAISATLRVTVTLAITPLLLFDVW